MLCDRACSRRRAACLAVDERSGNRACQGNIEGAECFGINIRNYSEIIWQPFYWWKRELSNEAVEIQKGPASVKSFL